ncbi:MAG: ribosome maturation factor RimM [Eubacterium sp.]
MKKETMIIGKILGAHGIRGELKVYPLTSDPGRFYELEQVYVGEENKQQTAHEIELVRLHKGNVLLTLKGINDRNASEKLIGRMVSINREDAVTLSEDEYFIEELIGMNVIDIDGKVIGVVKDILQTTGSTDTVEIKTPEKIICIPARKVYFLKVNVSEGIITVDIPEELMAL